jgi:predicted acetyltransferase
MPIEIRPAREDELDAVHFVVSYSFNANRTDAGRQSMRHVENLAHPQVLLDDGKIVASLRVYDLTMLMNGAPVRLGGVSSVSCLPEHRRKGHVGRLLRHAMSEMRDRGQPLSALYTPHPSLYRKYGWMTAASNLKYVWHSKSFSPYLSDAPSGHAERVAEDDWRVIEPMYRRYCEGRTGPILRDERWWREAFFRHIYDDERKLRDVAVWRDNGGEAVGYISYSHSRNADSTTTHVSEFVPLTGDACTGLLRYILSHDLSQEAFWHGPADDPFAYALDDAYKLKREFIDDYMLRVVDVPAAIAARPPAPGAPEGTFAVRIADRDCPWNNGAWRIENSGGVLNASPAEGAAALAMEAATFAAIYGGYVKASEALRSGLATGDRAAARFADRMLASEFAPFCYDFF